MSHLAQRSLKHKQPQLERALDGRLTQASRWILGELLDQYEQVEAAVERVQSRIRQEIERSSDPFVGEAVRLLDTIPGVAETVAQVIVAEIGVGMHCFASCRSTWRVGRGCVPATTNRRAKRKRGKTTKGSRYLRAMLVQAAWAASHQKDTYLAAQYHRLVKRMGKKKALVAVGHTNLVIAYHMLRDRVCYQELGAHYFDRRHKDQHRQRLIRQLQALGLKVTVEELEQAA